jgi:hypothetical protein
MRTGRWEWVAAAWAVCRQPYPAVGADLPMRFNLALALLALLDKLVKLLLELQECGLPPVLLGLWLLLLVIHGVPSVSHCPPALISLIRIICASASVVPSAPTPGVEPWYRHSFPCSISGASALFLLA